MGSLEVENERLRARVAELEGEADRRGRWYLSDEERHGSRAGLECPSGVAHGCTERCIHCDARDLINDFRVRAEDAEAELEALKLADARRTVALEEISACLIDMYPDNSIEWLVNDREPFQYLEDGDMDTKTVTAARELLAAQPTPEPSPETARVEYGPPGGATDEGGGVYSYPLDTTNNGDTE